MKKYWQSLSLVERIRIIRYVLPGILIPIVLVYQLLVAIRLEEAFGHPVHYAAEIGFYSLVGPVVTWFTLIWVERRLAESEALERQVRARTQQLASLTAASPDAILSLDHGGIITSWNHGASSLFGYSPEEMVGQPVDRIIPNAGVLTGQAPGRGTLQHLETTARTRLGHAIRVDLTRTQLEQYNGEASISLLIMRDVTFQVERAAILEEERARISRDLHDGLAQTLYFLALKADVAREEISTNPSQAVVSLKEIGQRARNAIRDVRRAIFGLKPLNWPEGEFLPSLKKFAEDFGQEVNLQVNIQAEVDSVSIPPRLELTIFRLVQESLNNVAKHANTGAVHVGLQIDSERGALILTIRDDGAGFTPESISRGMGLNQMKKRTEAAGGVFQLSSRPGEGVQVQAEIPLQRPGANHE